MLQCILVHWTLKGCKDMVELPHRPSLLLVHGALGLSTVLVREMHFDSFPHSLIYEVALIGLWEARRKLHLH